MAESNPKHRYQDQQALRRAVEKASRRLLTGIEWAIVAPAWAEPYDDADVAELVNAVRDTLAPRAKLSRDEQARQHRMAHVQRVALDARAMVELFREELFGQKPPPFPNGLVAADWIEALPQGPTTMRFSIQVTIPAELSQIESLVRVRDQLTLNLDRHVPVTTENESTISKQFLQQWAALRNISWERPLLAYLGLNPEGEIDIKRVPAPDGTLLGQLNDRAAELAKATDWEPYAAVHHLLTGGIVSPSAVRVTYQHRFGRQAFGDRHPMTLEISEPDAVTEQVLIAAYRRQRSSLDTAWTQTPQQRARVAPKSERVAAFVEETADMSWQDRLHQWNLQHPEDRFNTVSAIKQANRKASRR